jgi:hypothetical protein
VEFHQVGTSTKGRACFFIFVCLMASWNACLQEGVLFTYFTDAFSDSLEAILDDQVDDVSCASNMKEFTVKLRIDSTVPSQLFMAGLFGLRNPNPPT